MKRKKKPTSKGKKKANPQKKQQSKKQLKLDFYHEFLTGDWDIDGDIFVALYMLLGFLNPDFNEQAYEWFNESTNEEQNRTIYFINAMLNAIFDDPKASETFRLRYGDKMLEMTKYNVMREWNLRLTQPEARRIKRGI